MPSTPLQPRRSVALAFVATLLASPVAAQPVVPVLGTYAVLGVGDVRLGHGARVMNGAVGAIGGTVRLGRDARVATLAAPMVRFAAGARSGTLFCHFVSGPPPLSGCMAFTDPLIDPSSIAVPAVTPGSADLDIRAGTGTAPVPPGDFRDLRVGRGGLLQLAGGSYRARSLRIGAKARVVCLAACVIGVLDGVRVKAGGELGAEASARADTVRVEIAASGGIGFVARPRASVAATVFAPGTPVILGPRGTYRGAFIGAGVRLGAKATVRGDSAL